MASEENKAIVRRYLEVLFNQGDLTIADELVASDYTNHQVDLDLLRGPDVEKHAAASNRAVFPDCRMSIRDTIAEADRVMVRVTLMGTQHGDVETPIGTIPATGQPTRIDAVLMFRLANGKLAESWGVFDTMHALRQASVKLSVT